MEWNKRNLEKEQKVSKIKCKKRKMLTVEWKKKEDKTKQKKFQDKL